MQLTHLCLGFKKKEKKREKECVKAREYPPSTHSWPADGVVAHGIEARCHCRIVLFDVVFLGRGGPGSVQ